MAKVLVKDKMNAAEYRAYLEKREAGRNSKFGAIPTQTADGKKFESIWESEFYKELWVQQRAGEILQIITHERYEFWVNEVYICAYVLDFQIKYSEKSPHFAKYQDKGGWRYVDTKSSATITQHFITKKNLMQACHGMTIEAVKDPSLKKPNKPKRG